LNKKQRRVFAGLFLVFIENDDETGDGDNEKEEILKRWKF
jgi:hypothetical protein